MQKKIYLLLTTLIMVFAVFVTGCGGKEDPIVGEFEKAKGLFQLDDYKMVSYTEVKSEQGYVALYARGKEHACFLIIDKKNNRLAMSNYVDNAVEAVDNPMSTLFPTITIYNDVYDRDGDYGVWSDDYANKGNHRLDLYVEHVYHKNTGVVPGMITVFQRGNHPTYYLMEQKNVDLVNLLVKAYPAFYDDVKNM